MTLPAPWAVPVDPLLMAAFALTLALVVLARRRAAEPADRWRGISSVAALALLGAAWLSPLQTVASHYLLTGHLIQITVMMGAVPPLLLLGLPGRLRSPAPRWMRRLGWIAVHPLSGMIAVNAAFFGWHFGPAYDLSLQQPTLYAAQQVSLLLASVMFWWPIVAPMGSRRVLGGFATLGYILVATIPQTFGGITVALAHHSLYPTYAEAPRLWGLSVMSDQAIAGACIAVLSKLALFTAFGVIFVRMLGESATDGGDDGGGGRRRPDADTPSPRPSGSVPWLADLNAGRTVQEPAARPRPVRVPAGSGSRRG